MEAVERSEAFNPSDTKYRGVVDLPNEERSRFEDIGFVKKSAVKELRLAQTAVHIANLLHGTRCNALDVLHAEALLEDQKLIELRALNHKARIKKVSEELRYREESLTDVLREIPQDFMRDPGFVLDLMRVLDLRCRDTEKFWNFVPDSLRRDKKFMLDVTRSFRHRYMEYADVSLKSDKEFMMAAIQEDAEVLKYAASQLRGDREVVLAAVQEAGYVLQYASKALRDDLEIVRIAIQQNAYAFIYAGPEARKNKEIVLLFLQQEYAPHEGLDAIDPELWRDRDIVKLAVSCFRGAAFKRAATKFRGDEKIVRIALKGDPDALKYASPALRGNKGIVRKAVSQERGVGAAKYMNSQLRGELSIMMAFVKQDGDMLRKATPELRGNRRLVLAAVSEEGLALRFADPELRSDREVVLKAIEQDEQALRYASEELRKDKEIVLAALKKGRPMWGDRPSPCVFKFADFSLQSNPEVVFDAFQIDPRTFLFAPAELRSNKNFVIKLFKSSNCGNVEIKQLFKALGAELQIDRNVALALLASHPDFYSVFPNELKRDREVIRAAVSEAAHLINKVLQQGPIDQSFLLELIELNPSIYQYLPDELKVDFNIATAALTKDNKLSKSLPHDIRVKLGRVIGLGSEAQDLQ